MKFIKVSEESPGATWDVWKSWFVERKTKAAAGGLKHSKRIMKEDTFRQKHVEVKNTEFVFEKKEHYWCKPTIFINRTK